MKKNIASLLICVTLFSPLGVFAAAAVAGASTLFQQLYDNITQTAMAGNDLTQTGLQVGEKVRTYALEPILRQLAARMIIQMQNDTLNWIRSGFHGAGPAFVVNPDAYFKNVANEAIQPQLTAISKDLGNIFGKSVAANIIIGTRVARSLTADQLEYTLGNSIQKSLCNEANITRMAQEDIKNGLTVSGKVCVAWGDYADADVTATTERPCIQWAGNNQSDNQKLANKKRELYNSLCLKQSTNSVANLKMQQNLNTCFNNNFNCGGWDAWLGLTTNPNNNAYGQISRASTKIAEITNKKTKEVSDQMVNGIMAKTKCVPGYLNTDDAAGNPLPEDQQTCGKTEVVTPGAAVANALMGAQQSGSQQAASTNGIGLESILSALTTGILRRAQEGLISNAQSRGRNSSQYSTLALDTKGNVVTVYNQKPGIINAGGVSSDPIIPTGNLSFVQQIEKSETLLKRIKVNITDIDSLFISFEGKVKELESCQYIGTSDTSYIASTRKTYAPYKAENDADILAIADMFTILTNHKKQIISDPSSLNVANVANIYTEQITSGKIYNEGKEFATKDKINQYKRSIADELEKNLTPKLNACTSRSGGGIDPNNPSQRDY